MTPAFTIPPARPAVAVRATPSAAPAAPRNPAGLFLFLLVNATLFVRPSEILPGLFGEHVYLGLILACLVISFPGVLTQLTPHALRARPITFCVLGLLAAVVWSSVFNPPSAAARDSLDASGLTNFLPAQLAGAFRAGAEFLKLALYYLLFVALVNTPRQLQRFLWWFVLFCVGMVVVAVLHYHGIITIANLTAIVDKDFDAANGQVLVSRLRSTGQFNDPNELCLILVVAIPLCLYFASDRRGGPFAYFWWAPVLLFGYALWLTHSRGGFLALVLGAMMLLRSRFGWTRTLLLGGALLPVLFIAFAGRMTSISADAETGQSRIQIWSDGLQLLREHALTGVGYEEFAPLVGKVAHNSFLHCFAELGVVGGLLFLGAFYYALRHLLTLGGRGVIVVDPELRRLRPYLVGAVGGFVAGMLSLSYCYFTPTFMILGLATAYSSMATTRPPRPPAPLSARLVGQVVAASGIYLVAMYLFVRLLVRW